MLKRAFVCATLLAVALCACAHLPSTVPGTVPDQAGNGASLVAGGQRTGCEERAKGSPSELEACIQESSLWRRLSEFQRFADQNPGPDGHGNRDTGSSGYEASVDHVAGLMRRAGYKVTIQSYVYTANEVTGSPQFGTPSHGYTLARDWFVARGSGSGTVTAPVETPRGSSDGCSPSDFAGFTRGNIALLARGACAVTTQVANAQAAGASAVILYATESDAYETRIIDPVDIPVIGFATSVVGADLSREYKSGSAPTAHVAIQMRRRRGVDYNVIADSPFGDPNHIVAIDAHLDSIFGAGMLDNASGSTSILETALEMANTPTLNRLRCIWFGGEEIGLVGSRYYTTHLTPNELRRIVFDVDVDVTATPNFDIQIADPAKAHNVKHFPPNVVPESKVGNAAFANFFATGGVVSRPAPFGNDGTDSNSFALAGVPDTGVLTEQDCCKGAVEVKLWGGFRGNYEGKVPGFDGGCVDQPHRWCDNLSNNDPFVLELVSKAVAHVTFELADDASLEHH